MAETRDYTVFYRPPDSDYGWTQIPGLVAASSKEQAIRRAREKGPATVKRPEVQWEARSDWTPMVFGEKIVVRPNVLMSVAEQRKQREEASNAGPS
jgi:hypothetical protein